VKSHGDTFFSRACPLWFSSFIRQTQEQIRRKGKGYHGMGLHTALLSVLYAGGTVICIKKFIPPDFFSSGAADSAVQQPRILLRSGDIFTKVFHRVPGRPCPVSKMVFS
jgi:hypothetical protein